MPGGCFKRTGFGGAGVQQQRIGMKNNTKARIADTVNDP